MWNFLVTRIHQIVHADMDYTHATNIITVYTTLATADNTTHTGLRTKKRHRETLRRTMASTNQQP